MTIELTMNDWIYDIETYPNVFTCVLANAKTKKVWQFEISDRKDDSDRFRKMLWYIKDNNGRMVGYNNLGFDYPVIHEFLINKDSTYASLYAKAMEIIECPYEDRHSKMIFGNQILIPQLDLFKINHFDNVARSTSLKVLEFNMRASNIEDLPYVPGTVLKSDEIDNLISYNKWDVFQTYKFYLHNISAIKLREELSELYGRDFTNHNDTKIGKDYFIMRLEEAEPGICYDKRTRKPRQTFRRSINLGDVIFDYIKFERPEFQAVVDWLRDQNIKETKGVFTDVEEHELGELAKYAQLTRKRKKLSSKPTDAKVKELKTKRPLSWIEEVSLKSGKVSYYWCWNVADKLNTVVDGFRYDYGTGGIHGSIESQIVCSDDEYVIIDLDVASYYPNLAIMNKLYPEHLSELFCSIYKDVYVQRKGYGKNTPQNAVFKLALNGVYGDSNSKFSPFYDPKYTMGITVNGQLLLCILSEWLNKSVKDISVVQINTDGLTIRVPRTEIETCDKISRQWEELTGLELEKAEYSRMFIRDVNNYIAEYSNGKIKAKGCYEYTNRYMGQDVSEGLSFDWHKNHSSVVVAMAAEAALTRGEDIDKFIRNHDNPFDFMIVAKVPRNSRLLIQDDYGNLTEIQGTSRVYVSNEGYALIKEMPPTPKKPDVVRHIGIGVGWKHKVCNDMKDFCGDINYDYYIEEARKIVDPLLQM